MRIILLLATLIIGLSALEFAPNQPGDYERGYKAGYNALSMDMFQKRFDAIAHAKSVEDRYVEVAGGLRGTIKGLCGKFIAQKIRKKIL